MPLRKVRKPSVGRVALGGVLHGGKGTTGQPEEFTSARRLTGNPAFGAGHPWALASVAPRSRRGFRVRVVLVAALNWQCDVVFMMQ